MIDRSIKLTLALLIIQPSQELRAFAQNTPLIPSLIINNLSSLLEGLLARQLLLQTSLILNKHEHHQAHPQALPPQTTQACGTPTRKSAVLAPVDPMTSDPPSMHSALDLRVLLVDLDARSMLQIGIAILRAFLLATAVTRSWCLV